MSLLEKLDSESPSQLRRRSKESLTWFRNRVRSLKTGARDLYTYSDLTKTSSYATGKMYTYFYNPKHAQTLPYYDTFPCTIIIDMNQTGFTGLNLHYLPPRIRISFLNELFKYTNNQEFDETTRVEASWDLLNSIARLRPARACIKRYLTPNVVGQALYIEPQYWDIIAFLPTAQWNNANALDVYRESREKIDV